MILFSIASALLSVAQFAKANDIPLALYTDHTCSTPSTSNPNATLALDVCAVTTGLESFTLNQIACTTGNVQGWIFLDTACQSSGNVYPTDTSKHCYAPLEGGGIASLMLTCDQSGTTPPTPLSTTTIVVGAVANPGASNSSSTPGTDPSTDSSMPKSWWDNLSRGARIGLILALAVAVPSFISLAIIERKRKQRIAVSGTTYLPTVITQQTTTRVWGPAY